MARQERVRGNARAAGRHDSRVQVISAVLYVIGITLGVVGCVGGVRVGTAAVGVWWPGSS